MTRAARGAIMPAKHFRIVRGLPWCLIALVASASIASAQVETLTAVASIKSAGGVSSTAPVTIEITTKASDADRDALVAAVKSGGTAAAKAWLQKRPDAGTLQVGARRTPIKYVYVRDLGGDRLITVATAEPIAFVGGGMPGAKSTAGFDLGLAVLNVSAAGTGTGELSPAAKVTVDPQGAIVTQDFNSADLVHLTKVAKK